MEETHTSPSPVIVERQRPGRSFVTIVRVTTREYGFIFARLIDTAGDEPEECFIHKSTVPSELWDTLEDGHAITCKVQETSKGLRGWDIRAGSDDDQLRVDQLLEDHVNLEEELQEEQIISKKEEEDNRGNR